MSDDNADVIAARRAPASARRASPTRLAAHDHTVQFYESDDYLCDVVAAFMIEGLAGEQPLVAFTTREHRDALAARLAAEGHDFDELCLAGRLTYADARETLDTFMDGDVPDESRFREVVGGILEEVALSRGGLTVRAYGEMVDLLWRDGRTAAAIRVEELWNDLADAYAFELLCTYAMGNFYSEAHTNGFRAICERHSQVIPAEDMPALGNGDEAARDRSIAILQQRARALEAEVAERRRLEQALRAALAERKAAEEAMRSAVDEAKRAADAKSDFLAVVSHELRTPLNAIVGYRDLLTQEVGGPVSEKQARFLERIGASAHQLLHLIDQILTLSRMEADRQDLHRQVVDVEDIARETCEMVAPSAAKKGLALELNSPESVPPCITDAARLRQILINLLSNAVKFTDEGRVEVGIAHESGQIGIAVRDTGIGIHADDIDRCFEPFTQVDSSSTRARGGTGLGLPVSRDLAHLLGGTLTVESEPGVGSVFTLRIPVADAGLALDVGSAATD